jgi:hypothetical protein
MFTIYQKERRQQSNAADFVWVWSTYAFYFDQRRIFVWFDYCLSIIPISKKEKIISIKVSYVALVITISISEYCIGIIDKLLICFPISRENQIILNLSTKIYTKEIVFFLFLREPTLLSLSSEILQTVHITFVSFNTLRLFLTPKKLLGWLIFLINKRSKQQTDALYALKFQMYTCVCCI